MAVVKKINHDRDLEAPQIEGYLIVEIEVGNKKITALLDTGCKATLVSEDCYVELNKYNLIGGTLPVLGISIKGIIGKDAIQKVQKQTVLNFSL